jgi:siroheme synthase-like protein
MYPLFLKLEGRRVLVVGAGAVGAHKARELAAAGAHVVVVATHVRAELPAGVEVHARAFAAGDAKGAAVVIAATGDVVVDDAVAADARAHGALVNVVDRPAACDFYCGAVVTRGPVTVLVGTSGASPVLARKVRDRIEQMLPEALGVLADALGAARPRLLARFPVFAERARVLDSFVDRAWFRFVAGPKEADLRARIDASIEDELLQKDAS